jgi:hypothetical protein
MAAGAERGMTKMRTAIALTSALLIVGAAACGPKSAKSTASKTPTTFATPKAAAEALVAACRANDVTAARAILGSTKPDDLGGGDATTDAERCRRFVTSADQMMRLDPYGQGAVLVVGTDEFPVPAPLVQDASGWRFDGAEGAKEIRRRRIGADELTAIASCRSWARQGGAAPASAHGYTYRLAGTGNRPTLIAYPTDHGLTGIYTFQVTRDGVVYEKDLGAQTATAAATLDAGRDATWKTTWD